MGGTYGGEYPCRSHPSQHERGTLLLGLGSRVLGF